MTALWITLGIAAFLALTVLLSAWICYRMAFYSDRKKVTAEAPVEIPPGPIYDPFREQMITWVKEARAMNPEQFSIKSFDGLTLKAKYYEYSPDSPIELMFHGYRGNAERDLSGGVQRCFSLGHSALIVDQRGCGGSEGHVITFGINEHKDCLSWLRFMTEHFGNTRDFILTGISMGAATVMCCADKELPANVVGILADCGYDSPEHIIKEVIRGMKLPANLAYPLVKLGAKLFGHFDLEEVSPIAALKNAKVPVIFFHGEDDNFVPCSMSRDAFAVCAGKKRLVTVPGAGHGLSYPVAPEYYVAQAQEFFHGKE